MENLQTLTENYLEYCRTQKCLDEKTLKAYRIDLRQFSEEPSLEKITEITTNALEDYIARLHQQYKPKTVKKNSLNKSILPLSGIQRTTRNKSLHQNTGALS